MPGMFMSLPSEVLVLKTVLDNRMMIIPSVGSMKLPLPTLCSQILPLGTMRHTVVQPSGFVAFLEMLMTAFIAVWWTVFPVYGMS